MNTKELAKKYSLNQQQLDSFVLSSNYKFKSSMFNGIEVSEDPETIYQEFTKYMEEKKQKELENPKPETEKQKRERLQKELNQIIVTTTPVLPGYNVLECYGIVYGFNYQLATNALLAFPMLIKDAEMALRANAYNMGANAVVGVSFIPEIGPSTVNFMAYGTALKVVEQA